MTEDKKFNFIDNIKSKYIKVKNLCVQNLKAKNASIENMDVQNITSKSIVLNGIPINTNSVAKQTLISTAMIPSSTPANGPDNETLNFAYVSPPIITNYTPIFGGACFDMLRTLTVQLNLTNSNTIRKMEIIGVIYYCEGNSGEVCSGNVNVYDPSTGNFVSIQGDIYSNYIPYSFYKNYFIAIPTDIIKNPIITIDPNPLDFSNLNTILFSNGGNTKYYFKFILHMESTVPDFFPLITFQKYDAIYSVQSTGPSGCSGPPGSA
jgi:hypothetical protein